MRTRELKAISKHADGMSSDEEVPETDASAFRTQLGINIFKNVVFIKGLLINN